MLKEEAEWIQNEIAQLEQSNHTLFPMANIGCSDEQQYHFQPWVKALIESITEKGKLLNVDIKDSPNVDLVGDLLNPDFIAQLKTHNFQCLLCANILTNIRDKEKFAKSITEVIQDKGFLIVSVSNRYPYVADPVDTLYRPTPEELSQLFPTLTVVSSALVESDSYARLLWRKKKTLLITLIRLFVPFYKFKTWLELVKYLPKAFKPVRASCLVLQKS